MDYFKILPAEIILEILSRLPTEVVLECKLVCTNWRGVVRHPSFSRRHLHYLNHLSAAASDDSGKLGFLAYDITSKDNFYYFEYNDENNDQSTALIHGIKRINLTFSVRGTSFLSSCNGLIFLSGYRYPSVWICNPITREYLILPEIKRDSCDVVRNNCGRSSFGYVSSTNEYKVLTIYVRKTEFVDVYIYTLGSGNGWRNLGKFDFGSIKPWEQEGFFANGALYWMDYKEDVIVTFDLAEEKFREHLSLPVILPPDGDWTYKLGVLDGFFYFSFGPHVEEVECFDVWLLKRKNDYRGMKKGEEHRSLGWSKEFRVDDGELLAVTKSDGILTYHDNYLNIYDRKTSTSKRLVKFDRWNFRLSPHKNTLVSLKELGEEGTKTMESIETEEARNHAYPFRQLDEDANPEY